MQRYVLFLLAAIVLSAGGVGVVAADGGPLAAAGLDQEVGVNTTVQLDGTGSSHPDGRIDGYEWSIETPDGRTMRPACRACARTSFTPRSVGRYDVTLTVTDGEGRTDGDTLYVYVEEAGPTVDLSGDTEPAVNDPTPYNASARARSADLETLTWKLGDQTVARQSIDGQADWTRRSFSFTEADTYRLVVIASDSSNRTARDTITVEPRDAPEAVSSDSRASDGTTIAISNFSTAADDTETNAGCENAGVVRNPTGSGTAAAVTCVDGLDQETIDDWADEICSADISDCEYADSDGQDADRGSVSNNRVGNPGTGWDSISGGDSDGAGFGGLFGSGPSRSKVSAGGDSRGGYVI
jgi:hypothetical protein